MRKKDKRAETEPESKAERKRLTPIDIQQAVFRRALFRGYHEQEVDDFLDGVTEELALLLEEQRRLREQAADGMTLPLEGAGEVADASRMAEDIVARARDEAAAIVREAEERAASIPGAVPAGSSGISPFVRRERAFLRDLAQIIQNHAETVRAMAVATRRETPAEEAPSQPPTQESPAEEAEPIQVPEPEPAPAEAGVFSEAVPAEAEHGAGEPAREERSVKELFWGED